MRRLSLVFALTVVAVVRFIVPRRLRARWRAEWRAELRHRWQAPEGDVFSRSLSAIPHATALARHEWGPDTLLQDVRYAVRRLAGSPGFVIVAVLTIAIGVGANTAIFSVINSTLINPLPFPEADRLVYLWRSNGQMAVTPRAKDLRIWKEQVTSFEEMHIYAAAPTIYTGGDEPAELIGLRVAQNFLPFLGVQPARGRGFSDEEVRTDARVVVVSDGFWRNRLGADDNVLGTSILLDDEPYVVIGVLPRGFVFQVPFRDTPVWLPLSDSMIDELPSPFALARLKPGVSVEAVNDELDAIAAASSTDGDDSLAGFTGRARSPQSMIGNNFRTSILAIQVAVGFVLLIACANVANLLLARGTAQQREMAVRAAIGAGRGRLLRQLLTENLMLALAGGIVGYGFARAGVGAIMALKPEGMGNLDTVRVDPSMLLFALGVAVLTGVIFGFAPAWHSSRPDVLAQIKDTTRSGTPSTRRVWTLNGLVVAQVALSIVLLVGAGLILNSLGRLLASDVGFDPDNILTFSFSLNAERYPDPANQLEFYRQLDERIRQVAGDRLDSLAHVSSPPGRMGIWFGTFAADGEEPLPAFENSIVHHTMVSPEYFDAMRIPILHGRAFVATDINNESTPVIVNAEWARRMWGEVDVVGRRFADVDSDDPTYHTIVGVIGDARLAGRAPGIADVQSFAPKEMASAHATLLIRTHNSPLPMVDEMKRQVWALDPGIPIKDVALVEDLMSSTLAPQRFNATLVTLAAGIALSLALIGLYGVLSYSVGQRTREIGIRMALGAETASLVPMVAWQGMRLVIVGVVIGIAAALALTRFIESLLYEVTPSDWVTYVTVAAVLVSVAALACLVPAARAARLDPMAALRSE